MSPGKPPSLSSANGLPAVLDGLLIRRIYPALADEALRSLMARANGDPDAGKRSRPMVSVGQRHVSQPSGLARAVEYREHVDISLRYLKWDATVIPVSDEVEQADRRRTGNLDDIGHRTTSGLEIEDLFLPTLELR